MSETVSIDVEVTIDKVTCNCGRELDITKVSRNQYSDISIEVDPCEDCTLKSYGEGVSENE